MMSIDFLLHLNPTKHLKIFDISDLLRQLLQEVNLFERPCFSLYKHVHLPYQAIFPSCGLHVSQPPALSGHLSLMWSPCKPSTCLTRPSFPYVVSM